MPEYGFVTTHRWVKQLARQHDIHISSRKAEKVAAAWMEQVEFEADGVSGGKLDYADPTGDTAVARILKALRKAVAA